MMLAQKIQIGLIFLILAIAGFFFFRNTRQSFDYSVNSWVVERHFGQDKLKPILPTNPEDPKKKQLVTIFACADGQLEIIEYPNADPPHPPTLNPRLERRGAPREYKYLLDPLAPIQEASDPFQHALALAVYHQVYDRSLGLLGTANLTAEQSAKEVEARNLLNAVVNKTDAALQSGTFHKELMDQVMKALATYNTQKGDPEKDSKKADLARKVLEAASAYIKKAQDEKGQAITLYIKAIASMLTPAQQSKLVEAAQQWEQQNGHTPKNTAGSSRRGGSSSSTPQGSRGPARGRSGGARGG